MKKHVNSQMVKTAMHVVDVRKTSFLLETNQEKAKSSKTIAKKKVSKK